MGAAQQMRNAIDKLIQQNPFYATIQTKPMIADVNGGWIEDPFGVAVESSVRCRISHQKSAPATLAATNIGFDDDQAFYILVSHNSVLPQGGTLDYNGASYEIGPINTVRMFGQIISHEAPLKKIKNIAQVST
jgi:hypothetical protein